MDFARRAAYHSAVPAMTRNSIEAAAKGLILLIFVIFLYSVFRVMGMMGLF